MEFEAWGQKWEKVNLVIYISTELSQTLMLRGDQNYM